jgi:hypothetical protein
LETLPALLKRLSEKFLIWIGHNEVAAEARSVCIIRDAAEQRNEAVDGQNGNFSL